MIIKTLVENTSMFKNFGSEHGLSLYIETKYHRILFDVGASELFLENSKRMDVNIADVDFLVISHGHYDHGGGLKAFLQGMKESRGKVQVIDVFYLLQEATVSCLLVESLDNIVL